MARSSTITHKLDISKRGRMTTVRCRCGAVKTFAVAANAEQYGTDHLAGKA